MMELPKGEKVNCELFLSLLDGLPSDGAPSVTPELLLGQLPQAAREHVSHCTECRAAVADFTQTRELFREFAQQTPEPGPWFTRRVMNSIAAEELELEERQEGFWIGVRRLAPRFVALATLLLMLGGTWAFQERRAANSRALQLGPVEGIFESAPSAPANDDIIAVASYQEQAR
jgi:anti-sigma factor RsiW